MLSGNHFLTRFLKNLSGENPELVEKFGNSPDLVGELFGFISDFLPKSSEEWLL